MAPPVPMLVSALRAALVPLVVGLTMTAVPGCSNGDLAAYSSGSAGGGGAQRVVCALNSECNAPQVCLFGYCTVPCRQDRDCSLGARCLQTSMGTACVTPEDASCPAHVCPSGTTCSDGLCRTVCDEISVPCLTGQACRGAVCIGTDSGHDSTPTTGAGGGDGGGTGHGGGGQTSGAGGVPAAGGASGSGGAGAAFAEGGKGGGGPGSGAAGSGGSPGGSSSGGAGQGGANAAGAAAGAGGQAGVSGASGQGGTGGSTGQGGQPQPGPGGSGGSFGEGGAAATGQGGAAATGQGGGAATGQGGAAASGQGAGGSAACSHSPCETGAPLSYDTCGPCESSVCSSQGSCCFQSWDASCVAHASQICAQCGGSGAAAGASSGGGGQGGQGGVSTGGSGGAVSCSHSTCAYGSPLGTGCSACTSDVCAASGLAYCCMSAWDENCVQAAQTICSVNAPCDCGASMTNCGGKCVDITSDGANCGSCGTLCGGAKICMSGVCQK